MNATSPYVVGTVAVLLVSGCGPRGGHLSASEGAPVQVRATGFRAATSRRHDVDGSVYGNLQADASDTLESIAVPASVATAAELRETTMDSLDRTTSRLLPRLALPANHPVTLEPGGKYVRLVELARPLRAPHTVTVHLRFTRGGEKVLELPIRDE